MPRVSRTRYVFFAICVKPSPDLFTTVSWEFDLSPFQFAGVLARGTNDPSRGP